MLVVSSVFYSDCDVLVFLYFFFFFFKQKTAYEMRISDWSSDVCSSDLDGYTLAMAQTSNMAVQPRLLKQFDERLLMIVAQRLLDAVRAEKIGRASCRERVCQYV